MRYLQDDPLATLAALVVVAGGLYFGSHALVDLIRFPSRPLETDVPGAVAAGRQWVAVSGAWDCERVFHHGASHFVPAFGPDGTSIVADFQYEMSCEEVAAHAVVGVVDEVPEELHSAFAGAGFNGVHRLLSVTATDKKQDSLIGVLLCFIGVPALIPFMLWLRRRQSDLYGWSRAQFEAAAAADPESKQADAGVRKHGALLLVLGGLLVAMGLTWAADWYVLGLVPLAGAGAFVLALGAFEVMFPRFFRGIYARARRTDR